MFRDYTLQTTWGRALVALAGGAVVGAIGITLLDLPDRWYIWNGDFLQVVTYWADLFFYNLYYVSIALFLAGPPIWILAHRLGFRTWAGATFVGFGLSFSVVFLAGLATFMKNNMSFENQIKSLGVWFFVYPFIALPLIGTLVALTIWRIAYRRPLPNA